MCPEVSIVAIPFGRYGTNEDGMHDGFMAPRRRQTFPLAAKLQGVVNSAFAKTDANRAGFDEVIVLNHDGHVSKDLRQTSSCIATGVGDATDYR